MRSAKEPEIQTYE